MKNAVSADQSFMQRAIELARQGLFTTAPNPNVGCVIVADGAVIGEGYHHQAGSPHAEVNALNAIADANRAKLAGATVYVTLEPCSHFGRTPPCANALVEAGVKRVVIAMQDPNPEVSGRGIARLQDAGIAVDLGVLAESAEQLNLGFCQRMRTGLPWVRLKMAASLDGKTALENGQSQWITAEAARADVHRWRACSGAVLSTAATVIADHAMLTARGPDAVQQPLRVILDPHNAITPDVALIQVEAPIWLLQGTPNPRQDWPVHCEVEVLQRLDNGRFDLAEVLKALGRRQINDVWVEAGHRLAGALWQAQLVNELVLYLAPKLMGHSAQSLIALDHFTRMSEVPELDIHDVCRIGKDLRIQARPAQAK